MPTLARDPLEAVSGRRIFHTWLLVLPKVTSTMLTYVNILTIFEGNVLRIRLINYRKR